MHVEVRVLYPDAELSQFIIEQLTPDHLTLQYSSKRKLGDLAHGLIVGSLNHYHEKATILKTNMTEKGREVLFDIIKEASAPN